jgi:hypothetical protein
MSQEMTKEGVNLLLNEDRVDSILVERLAKLDQEKGLLYLLDCLGRIDKARKVLHSLSFLHNNLDHRDCLHS